MHNELLNPSDFVSILEIILTFVVSYAGAIVHEFVFTPGQTTFFKNPHVWATTVVSFIICYSINPYVIDINPRLVLLPPLIIGLLGNELAVRMGTIKGSTSFIEYILGFFNIRNKLSKKEKDEVGMEELEPHPTVVNTVNPPPQQQAQQPQPPPSPPLAPPPQQPVQEQSIQQPVQQPQQQIQTQVQEISNNTIQPNLDGLQQTQFQNITNNFEQQVQHLSTEKQHLDLSKQIPKYNYEEELDVYGQKMKNVFNRLNIEVSILLDNVSDFVLEYYLTENEDEFIKRYPDLKSKIITITKKISNNHDFIPTITALKYAEIMIKEVEMDQLHRTLTQVPKQC